MEASADGARLIPGADVSESSVTFALWIHFQEILRFLRTLWSWGGAVVPLAVCRAGIHRKGSLGFDEIRAPAAGQRYWGLPGSGCPGKSPATTKAPRMLQEGGLLGSGLPVVLQSFHYSFDSAGLGWYGSDPRRDACRGKLAWLYPSSAAAPIKKGGSAKSLPGSFLLKFDPEGFIDCQGLEETL